MQNNEHLHEEDIIICEICGEENSTQNKFCSNCGIKLKGETSKRVVQKKTVVQKPPLSSAASKIPNKKNDFNVKKDKSSDFISFTKSQFITILAGLVGIIFLILFLAGVFDSKESEITQQNQFNQGQPGQLEAVNEINALEDKVKANPNDLDSRLQLSHLLHDSGFFDRAVQSYKIYLEKVPANADARVDMGVCYFELKQYDNAIAAMEEALKYQPKHQTAHMNLGVVNLNAGNTEKAKEWFTKTIEIDPTSPLAENAKKLLNSH